MYGHGTQSALAGVKEFVEVESATGDYVGKRPDEMDVSELTNAYDLHRERVADSLADMDRIVLELKRRLS